MKRILLHSFLIILSSASYICAAAHSPPQGITDTHLQILVNGSPLTPLIPSPVTSSMHAHTQVNTTNRDNKEVHALLIRNNLQHQLSGNTTPVPPGVPHLNLGLLDHGPRPITPVLVSRRPLEIRYKSTTAPHRQCSYDYQSSPRVFGEKVGNNAAALASFYRARAAKMGLATPFIQQIFK